MFAVIKTGGKQYLISPGDKIKVEKLKVKEGEKVIFDQVLLLDKDGKTEIGAPLVESAKVEAKLLKQGKAKKVVIFKHHPKKRYQKKKGHRQPFSEVEITKIVL